MDFNEYYLEWYVRGLLADARAAAAREALGSRGEISRPALRALAARARQRYARWSSAASAGSKPTTARA
jgi:hypothetical protein